MKTEIRSKGVLWLANHNDVAAEWSQAGLLYNIHQAGVWAASVPQDDWPDIPGFREQAMEVWQVTWGDRRTELIIIGQGLDVDTITETLWDCLLNEVEMSFGPDRWAMFSDPLPQWCE